MFDDPAVVLDPCLEMKGVHSLVYVNIGMEEVAVAGQNEILQFVQFIQFAVNLFTFALCLFA